MIVLSSIIYDMLLRKVHSLSCTTSLQSSTSPQNIQHQDGDDVYYRLGGAVLSDMLHLRYRSIKTCHKSRRDIISQEVTILQVINTKDKACMPDYLKYRDRGYMYSPNHTFVPFFRQVDNCVREVVNQTGFEEHKDELVKVILNFN